MGGARGSYQEQPSAAVISRRGSISLEPLNKISMVRVLDLARAAGRRVAGGGSSEG